MSVALSSPPPSPGVGVPVPSDSPRAYLPLAVLSACGCSWGVKHGRGAGSPRRGRCRRAPRWALGAGRRAMPVLGPTVPSPLAAGAAASGLVLSPWSSGVGGSAAPALWGGGGLRREVGKEKGVREWVRAAPSGGGEGPQGLGGEKGEGPKDNDAPSLGRWWGPRSPSGGGPLVGHTWGRSGTFEARRAHFKIMQILPENGLKREKDKSCGHLGIRGDPAGWERHVSI